MNNYKKLIKLAVNNRTTQFNSVFDKIVGNKVYEMIAKQKKAISKNLFK